MRCLAAVAAVCVLAALSAGQSLPEVERHDLAPMSRAERAEIERRVGASVRDLVPGDGQEPIDFDAAAGRVVVLHAWQSSSVSSRRRLEMLHASLCGQASGSVLVAMNMSDRGVVPELPGEVEVVHVSDAEHEACGALGLRGRSDCTLIVDEQGVLRYVGLTRDAAARIASELSGVRAPHDGRTVASVVALDETAARIGAVMASPPVGADWSRFERDMEVLWEGDRPRALDYAWRLLSVRDVFYHPLGIAQFERHATGQEVLTALENLPSGRRDERERRLIRAIGSAEDLDLRQRLAALADHHRSGDEQIRASVALALGDTGSVEALPALLELMDGQSPRSHADWPAGPAERVSFWAYGAARSITGLERGDKVDYERWLEIARRSMDDAEAVSERSRRETGIESEPFRFQSDTFRAYDGMDLTYRFGSVGEVGDRSEVILGRLLPDGMERAAERSDRVWGARRAPVIRVSVASETQFNALGGTAGFAGVAQGNRMSLRLDRPELVAGVMPHEFFHILHQNAYPRQPRWLAEGSADSVTRSVRSSVWTMGMVRAAEIEPYVDQGAVTAMLGWTGGGATGEEEGKRYACAWLVVDFLRFGGFGAGDERLGFFMAAIGDGQSPTLAAGALYGLSPGEMDERLRQWLGR